MPTGTHTSFGRYHAPEPLHNMTLVHRHAGGPLTTVDHEPALGVLDQEDLFAQGIDTSAVVPGAKKVDALGSCTAQADTVAISNLGLQAYLAYLTALGVSLPDPSVAFSDVVTAEKGAIVFYSRCSHQTGDPAQEWPPTDCGSSGQYVVEEDQTLGVVSTQRIAQSAQDIMSLLQDDGVLIGGPWLNAWMEPDANGFVDGDGSASTLEAQINQGTAGGHERYMAAVEELALTETGLVIPEKTIIRERNSWSKSWGDEGSYRIHLSTHMALLNYSDFRQLVA